MVGVSASRVFISTTFVLCAHEGYNLNDPLSWVLNFLLIITGGTDMCHHMSNNAHMIQKSMHVSGPSQLALCKLWNHMSTLYD